MAFEPVKLVHPKTGQVVIATTPVDLTNFRFNDGYVAADTATLLVGGENGEEKYPGLVEGLKKVEQIEADEEAAAKAEAESPKSDVTPAPTEDAKVDAKSDAPSDDGKAATSSAKPAPAAKPASGTSAAAK